MGFTRYYKIKVYVDNGIDRYETWKYVFSDNEENAKKSVLEYYDRQHNTLARIIESCAYTIQDGMMFDGLIISK